MKKDLKIIITQLLLFFMCISIYPAYAQKNNNAETDLENPDTVNLVIDNKNIQTLPNHFRKTTDLSNIKTNYINISGLDKLNISGSEQFSPCNLDLILKNINRVCLTKNK